MENSQIQRSESETADSNLEKIQQYQNEYYRTNPKNTFFKKAQKQECAESICNQFSLEDLMNSTFWIVPNKNQLYFDYRTFKVFGNPAVYSEIVENVLRLCQWCVDEYGTFDIHVNISSFTISAAERYKDLIRLFCDECTRRDTCFSELLNEMNFHNTPNSIDQISKMIMPMLPVEVRPKLRLFKKEQSTEILKQLYEESYKIYSP